MTDFILYTIVLYNDQLHRSVSQKLICLTPGVSVSVSVSVCFFLHLHFFPLVALTELFSALFTSARVWCTSTHVATLVSFVVSFSDCWCLNTSIQTVADCQIYLLNYLKVIFVLDYILKNTISIILHQPYTQANCKGTTLLNAKELIGFFGISYWTLL